MNDGVGSRPRHCSDSRPAGTPFREETERGTSGRGRSPIPPTVALADRRQRDVCLQPRQHAPEISARRLHSRPPANRVEAERGRMGHVRLGARMLFAHENGSIHEVRHSHPDGPMGFASKPERHEHGARTARRDRRTVFAVRLPSTIDHGRASDLSSRASAAAPYANAFESLGGVLERPLALAGIPPGLAECPSAAGAMRTA
jgi:hypothetical protein